MSEPDRTAGWQVTSEELIGGLCHELNGRISALVGIVQLAALDGLVDGDVGRELEVELERVERIAGLLRHLGTDRGGEPEPVRLTELLPQAHELLRRHRTLGEIAVELDSAEDPAPVLVRWVPLVRLLVLLLAHTAGHALRLGSDRIRAELAAGTDRVSLMLWPVPNGSRASAEDGGDPQDRALAAELRDYARALGGTLTAGAQGRPGVTLELPVWTD